MSAPSVCDWLLAAVGGRALPALPPGEDPWSEILASAARHGLAPVLWERLNNLPGTVVPPPDIMDRLHDLYLANAARNFNLTEELKHIIDRLESAGVQVILLKGIALAHAVYQKPAHRTMGDLDLWVPKPRLPDALRVLEDLGYRARPRIDRPPVLQEEFGGETQLIGNRPGIGLLELHWNLFAGEWLRHTSCPNEDEIRSRTVPCPVLKARQLAPEDMLLHICVHAAVGHQLCKNGLRSLLDVEMMRRLRIIDWRLVAQRAQAWRVRKAVWLVLALAGEWFGAETELIDSLSPSLIVRRLLRRFVSLRSIAAGRPRTSTPLRFLYQLALVDRPADALRLARNAFFPERRWLVARYQLENAPAWRVGWQRLWHPLRSVYKRNF